MGVYTRYKKDPNGFRKLVELLEITPRDKREKMIAAGLAEDPDYTKKAIAHMMNFQDIMTLPDMEFAEVIGLASPKILAMAFSAATPELKTKVLTLAPRKLMADIKDIIDAEYKTGEIGGAQLKMIEYARDLERRGKIQLKRIS